VEGLGGWKQAEVISSFNIIVKDIVSSDFFAVINLGSNK
jgi:hypothetical protein